MADLGEWQLVLAAIGTAALVVALLLTACATRAAVEANRISRKSAEQQLRAYVLPAGTKCIEVTSSSPSFMVTIENTGQTPAYGVCGDIGAGIYPSDQKDFSKAETSYNSGPSIGAGQDTDWFIDGSAESIAAEKAGLLDGSRKLFVFGKVTYYDVFKTVRHTDFRFFMKPGDGFRDAKLTFCDDGNEAD